MSIFLVEYILKPSGDTRNETLRARAGIGRGVQSRLTVHILIRNISGAYGPRRKWTLRSTYISRLRPCRPPLWQLRASWLLAFWLWQYSYRPGGLLACLIFAAWFVFFSFSLLQCVLVVSGCKFACHMFGICCCLATALGNCVLL